MKAKDPLEDISAEAEKFRLADAGQERRRVARPGRHDRRVRRRHRHRLLRAEAAGNTLTGTAVVAGCAGCSGGAEVGSSATARRSPSATAPATVTVTVTVTVTATAAAAAPGR
ncbi:hypothetical protein GCM10010259_55200 [Streptomyces daghestanicus]|uniref:Uncharacterized protein n=1 Tax=Streptomyces daghestanicus TaxID=66885 RepID=A0ABQ3QE04_9ACTN|nr:hypothetical protein GCM10010259_55200 [Streptomyces daghestanicus]GHI35496.1 hypothetical protein Sdagh_72260 [Streptomyces daghestanicus]